MFHDLFTSLKPFLAFCSLLGVVAILAACSGGQEDTASLPKYDVKQILDDYETNEARANQTYKGQRFIVSGQIEKIEDDSVEFSLGDFVFADASAKFRDKNELVQLNPDQQISLACEGDGFDLNIMLKFKDCTLP